MTYEYWFLLSLILTIIIETIPLFVIFRFFLKTNKNEVSNSLLLFAGIFSSFSTLPYLWFILPQIIRSYNLLTVSGEISVVLIEAIVYFFVLRTNMKKSLIISLICNLISFLAGLLISPTF